MKEQIKEFEKDFKVAMQVSEREIMSSFAFKTELKWGGALHATLGETMHLTEDHLVIKYQTDFEHSEDRGVSSSQKDMRTIEHDFSNDEELMKDVQIVVDENHLNLMLLNMFHHQETQSMTENLIGMWPDGFYGGAAVIKSIMSVAVWSFFFPELAAKYSPTTQVDFRCGFGEEFLKQGGLQHGIVSKVHFKEHNKI